MTLNPRSTAGLVDLPAAPEDPWWTDLVKEAPGRSVLYLGAGTGRAVVPLVASCDELVAVEADPRLRHALEERIARHAPLEDRVEVMGVSVADLRLARTFGLVVVPPVLINGTEDPSLRVAYLRAAARHCRPDGWVGVEVIDPYWLATFGADLAGRITSSAGEQVAVEVSEAGFDPWEQRSQARVTYRFPSGDTVTDRFAATALYPRELRALAYQSGLEIVDGPDEASADGSRTWRLAMRAPTPGTDA